MAFSVPLLLTLALGWFMGGWPWAAILLLAALVASKQASNSAAIAMAAFWILTFWIVGDRRIFFPYTMLLAVYAACIPPRLWLRMLTGAGMVATFLGIRLWQDASREVLLFELLVAAAILGFALVIAARTNGKRTLLIAAAGSLLAFLSLAL